MAGSFIYGCVILIYPQPMGRLVKSLPFFQGIVAWEVSLLKSLRNWFHVRASAVALRSSRFSPNAVRPPTCVASRPSVYARKKERG